MKQFRILSILCASAFYPFCPHPHFILFVRIRILSFLSASAFYPFCPHPHFIPFVRPSVRPPVRPRVRPYPRFIPTQYGAQVWHGNLTQDQSNNIERIQKRALIYLFNFAINHYHAFMAGSPGT
jgi:hypothetical protein